MCHLVLGLDFLEMMILGGRPSHEHTDEADERFQQIFQELEG